MTTEVVQQYNVRRSIDDVIAARTRPLFLKRAVGIIRVSEVGNREGERFVSPDDQRLTINRFSEREQVRLVRVFEELDVSAFSNKLAKRPGLRQAVEMVEQGDADIIVVAYFDRFFRNMAVQRETMDRVARAGGSMVAIDYGELREDTAAKWLNLQVMGLMAEWVSRSTREKLVGPKERAISRGIPTFATIPPGYLRGADRRLVVDEPKAALVREAYERRAAGASLKDLVVWAESVGLVKSYRALQEMLRNRIYLGELRFGTMVNLNSHPAILDPVLFKEVVGLRVGRGPRAGQSIRLLARLGVVRCASCGSRMVVGGQDRHRADGTKIRYVDYRCNHISNNCEARPSISAELLEAKVVRELKRYHAEGLASMDERLVEAEAEAQAAEARFNAAVQAFDGLGNIAATRTKLLELQSESDAARERLATLQAAFGSSRRVTLEDWDRLSLHGQRLLIRATIKQVIVRRGGSGADDRVTVQFFEQ